MGTTEPHMTVVADTREQTPFEFSDRVLVVRRALATGDYSLEGLEDQVAFERKSIDELTRRSRFGRDACVKIVGLGMSREFTGLNRLLG